MVQSSALLLLASFAGLTTAFRRPRSLYGNAIQCKNGDGSLFRQISSRQIRRYPNSVIAASWDPKWNEPKTIDCTGMTRRPDMRHRIGASVKCGDDVDAVYRITAETEIRRYPNRKIAESWDPKWEEVTLLSCTELSKDHPAMRHKIGSTIQCNDTNDELFRVTSTTEMRRYPNKKTASVYDPAWKDNVIRIDCSGLSEGPDMPQPDWDMPNPPLPNFTSP